MSREVVAAMVRRPAPGAALPCRILPLSFRAAGITEYMRKGGDVETATRIAGRCSRTTRSSRDVSLNEIERIHIRGASACVLAICSLGTLRCWSSRRTQPPNAGLPLRGTATQTVANSVRYTPKAVRDVLQYGTDLHLRTIPLALIGFRRVLFIAAVAFPPLVQLLPKSRWLIHL